MSAINEKKGTHMRRELYVKRTDYPANMKCARCGELPENHRVAATALYCRPVERHEARVVS